jgi:hypothetical protein
MTTNVLGHLLGNFFHKLIRSPLIQIGTLPFFSLDLFPTTHRATALSTASAFARIGSLVSPFVAILDPMTTIVVYGVCLVASAAVR